jgi:hypothetical protein
MPGTGCRRLPAVAFRVIYEQLRYGGLQRGDAGLPVQQMPR